MINPNSENEQFEKDKEMMIYKFVDIIKISLEI
jgi:hypothetical protein